MSVYYDALRIEIKVGEVWVDLTPDVLQNAGITASQGIMGSGALDRVASAGQCVFTLRNDKHNSAGKENYYTPGHVNCMSGFRTGAYIRVVVRYLDIDYVIWYGKIIPDGIKPYVDRYAGKVTVTSRDYFEELAIHELYLPEFTENKKANEIAALILANLPIQPLSTQYYSGQTTFRTVFDTVRPRTRALAELDKLALSEWGYFYVRTTQASMEEFICEGRFTRNEITSLSQIQYPSDEIIYLTTEGGDYLTTEGGDRLILDINGITEDAEFIDNALSIELSHSRDFYNSIRIISYPREIDAAADTILFELQRPIELLPGEANSITIVGRFSDPNAKASKVAGINMVTPQANTHYEMNELEDGTGTDLTSYLSVTRTYGVDGFEDKLTNTGVQAGWVTKLTAVGRGIYIYDAVEKYFEDEPSILLYGRRQLSVDMKYLDNPLVADDLGTSLINQLSDQRTLADSVTYIANRSEKLMLSFLQIPIGAKIYIRDGVSGVDQEFFINGKNWTIRPGGIIEYSYIIRAASLDTYNFWYLGIEGESELGINTVLGF